MRTIDEVKKALDNKGYQFFNGNNIYKLNIIGIRSIRQIPNSFDDSIVLIYNDKNLDQKIEQFPFTTDPGTYYLNHPINPQGCAILKEGQYIDTWQVGMHRGKYLALVQRKPVTVYRDTDKDGNLDLNGKMETGLFGIDIHYASASGTTEEVGHYSAGCQVFQVMDNFMRFMQLVELHKQHNLPWFSYTLLNEADFVTITDKDIPDPKGLET